MHSKGVRHLALEIQTQYMPDDTILHKSENMHDRKLICIEYTAQTLHFCSGALELKEKVNQCGGEMSGGYMAAWTHARLRCMRGDCDESGAQIHDQ